jgi:SAM-dependent MidA family methyltransferase
LGPEISGFEVKTPSESRIPNPESPLATRIRERGPLTVAAFMELALYDPDFGYYARAAQRSGRAGDFFTSVDVGPLFGELLEVQLEEMARLIARPFDLVEAGAGNGRLSADILRAAKRQHPEFYDSVRLHLVEASAAARRAQEVTLAGLAERLVSSGPLLPDSFEGVLLANELLDAMPVHQVVMRGGGLREVYVDHAGHLVEGPASTPLLAEYLDRVDARLEPGWRVEINLRAIEWIRDAARRLRRGFLVIIDYGHDARELYSASHSAGTLTTFSEHRSAGSEMGSDAPAWLQHPGEQDITAHVDFTSVRAAAEAEGLTTLGFLDQTYFVMGLLPSIQNPQSQTRSLKMLVMPGGLGSIHKVLILAKNVGTPSLKGCSYRMRVT